MKFLVKVLYIAIAVTLLSEGVVTAQSNWDKVLDRYELISAQCIELRQRIASGESVSSKSVTTLLQELSTLRTTLSGASGAMSSSQKKRFEKIRDSYSSSVGIESSTKSMSSESKQKKTVSSTKPEADSTPKEDNAIKQRDVLLIERIDSLISAPIIEFASESDIVASSAPHYEEPIDPMFSVNPISVGGLGIVELTDPIAYGAMVFLSYQGIGVYIQGSSSFTSAKSSYSCFSSGQINSAEGGSFWGTGASRKSSYSIIAGAMIDLPYRFSPFVGCGYGAKSVYWEDISGNLAGVDDLSAKGALVNAGILKSFRALTVSLSATYMPKMNAITPSVGVGVQF